MSSDPASLPVESESDANLVKRSRDGDREAFGELWRRHERYALAAARSISTKLDPEELVSEAFANIWRLLKDGRGPTAAFRPYLLVAVRNLAARIGGRNREFATDFPDDVVDESSLEGVEDRRLDREMAARAYEVLPPRWQEVLWYTEVERMNPRDTGQIMGIAPAAVSMLSMRARERLRQAWIQAHISSSDPETEHGWALERMGAFARNALGRRDQERFRRHVDACTRCQDVADEARNVGSRLRAILLPIMLGSAGAVGYESFIDGRNLAAAQPAKIAQGATSQMSPFASKSLTLLGVAGVGAIAATVAVVIATSAPTSNAPIERAETPPQSSAQIETLAGQKLAARVDRGPNDAFYPIFSGSGPAGSTIAIRAGSEEIYTSVIDSSETWVTPQLEIARQSVTVSLVEDTAASIEIASGVLHPPRAVVSRHGQGWLARVSGERGLPFSLRASSGPLASSQLDQHGQWSATYEFEYRGGELTARYAAGNRFGPWSDR